MRIRISKGVYVSSRTLFRFEWRRYYPALVIHEKFEKYLKWTLRILTLIGVGTSVLTLPWYFSLCLAIILVLIEQFFERTAMEYTTMIVQPLPPFELKYEQWKTNSFLIPFEKNDKDYAFFSPTYIDKQYAINFFKYLRSWIDNDSNDDTDNDLVISFIIEPNEEYTTYFYANLKRKRLGPQFKFLGDASKYEKKGKRQQQFIHQMCYWNTLDFKDGFMIKKFLEFRKPNETFIFAPSVLTNDLSKPEFLFEHGIRKYQYKIKYRHELKRNEMEHHFDPKKYETEK